MCQFPCVCFGTACFGWAQSTYRVIPACMNCAALIRVRLALRVTHSACSRSALPRHSAWSNSITELIPITPSALTHHLSSPFNFPLSPILWLARSPLPQLFPKSSRLFSTLQPFSKTKSFPPLSEGLDRSILRPPTSALDRWAEPFNSTWGVYASFLSVFPLTCLPLPPRRSPIPLADTDTAWISVSRSPSFTFAPSLWSIPLLPLHFSPRLPGLIPCPRVLQLWCMFVCPPPSISQEEDAN